MFRVVEKSREKIEHLREQVHRGLQLLKHFATYEDLYVCGFIPEGTNRELAEKVIEDEKSKISR